MGSHGRNGIRILGLSLLAALGLMAFAAAAAQAGEYRIEGKTLTERGIASESVEGAVAAGKLLVPGLGFTIACTGGTSSGTILLGGITHATVLYSGCSVEGNKFCKIYETKTTMETHLAGNQGFILASGLGEIILMGEKRYTLVSSGATPFSVTYMARNIEGCTLGLEEALTGSFVLEMSGSGEAVNQEVKTVSQATVESLFNTDILKYGNQSIWLDEGGTTNAHLTGANNGKAWGGE